MLRLLLILLQVIFLVAVFLLLRHNTGMTTLQILDVNISLHTSLLSVGFLLFGMAIYWLTSCWYDLRSFFERRHYRLSLGKWQESFDYLLKAETTTLKGLDRIPHLEKSAQLGKQHPYIQFLTAKSYLDRGDLQKAKAGFLPLLQKKETKLTALYGLITIARASGEPTSAFAHAVDALKLAPHSSLIHRELLEICLKNPDLTIRFSKEVLPIFDRHNMAKNEEVRPLYTAWLLLQSRQHEAARTLITDNSKTAITLANKAFNISGDDPLAFERVINSLTAHGKQKYIKKAGRLIRKHWHQFASLGLGRTYRDVILKEQPSHKKIQALRKLLKTTVNAEATLAATGNLLLAETLVEHGIWGEASVILENLEKEAPLVHRETRLQLCNKIQHRQKTL